MPKQSKDDGEKINVRERLTDNLLDLSLMNISTIPVNEIKALRRATILDLSNNRIGAIKSDFLALTQLTQLDLSKNRITSICDDFGQLTNLRRLDLYNNQITRLPLSFGRLRNLKYLDLKNNPLHPALGKKIGTFSDTSDCLAAANRAVELMKTIEQMMISDCMGEIELRNSAEGKQPNQDVDTGATGKSKRRRKHLNGAESEQMVQILTKDSDTDKGTEKRKRRQGETVSSKGARATILLAIGLVLLLALVVALFSTHSGAVQSFWEKMFDDPNENRVQEEYIK
ncbi:leucine-rich repeat-containing protein 59-like [Anopheles bellator]|uniref:leucine-rich repeat-containing protein 59-like n=1 Tax=Anopheles bellator TaxID=139047 RepID=UPI00264A1CB5|nr:leucine-rich repeat-containing protein 59-like [Anopheles bellator]